MKAEQVLAFRLARSGLAARRARTLAEAAACPASDFARDAALLALAARARDVTRESYEAAVDTGALVVAYVIRGAIHALAPSDFPLYGRALIGADDHELGAQMGTQAGRLGVPPKESLEEVTAATRDALAAGPLDKNELHEELRKRVRSELMPYCQGCKSHHVAPMLWRFAVRQAGVRLDSRRRYRLDKPVGPAPPASEAVRRFLSFYGPGTPGEFAEWAGVTGSHAQRLWDEVAGELVELDGGWLLPADRAELESPASAEGILLLPPGDPYLQKPNRRLLAPNPEVRSRLFRPVGSPGVVLRDGRLAGLWRLARKGRTAEIAVEKLGRLGRTELEEPAQRVAELRGAAEVKVVFA